MLEWLIEIDRAVFFFLNVTIANPVTDAVMPIVTSDNILRILYGLAMLLCLWRGDARLRWLVLFSGIALALTDQSAANFLKHAIERPRPCHDGQFLTPINLLVHCGGGYSMPSAHAANSFGQALLFGLAYHRVRWYLIGFAAIVSLSRVSVGVHYPGDVLVGAAVGSLVGSVVFVVFQRVRPFLPPRSRVVESSLPHERGDS
ncbi:MAG: phosphatase PAP2 family protein [candidate division Zixibacteria bacterium]|jgi:undecaprenyl-diphosphatase|nr:phosphatase PAP2 family protein [candidate division Zixibacteria bacterium]